MPKSVFLFVIQVFVYFLLKNGKDYKEYNNTQGLFFYTTGLL